MGLSGLVNLGQLARERHGRDEVVLVGFGTHGGTVVAGAAWGAGTRVMPVPPARPGSLEEALHHAAPGAALFVFPRSDHPDLLTATLPHRAIGVVYHPEREQWGNYVATVLGERYDAFLWFDRTSALHPLDNRRVDVLEPETYPSGV
jgi:erythromycin esterase-like protein